MQRRKLGGGLLIIAGIAALIIPFLLSYQIQPTITPPPTGGNNHGGKDGSGTTPPCGTNCTGASDNQAPSTSFEVTGPVTWLRNNIEYYYPNVTISLLARDDQSLRSITLNDTGVITVFAAQGKSFNITTTLTTTGLHVISYHSADQAGNKETPHSAKLGLGKPDLSDLQNIISNSNIDNQGIKNAMLAKINTAQIQLAAGQTPTALNALSNQVNALDGKHGLDQATTDLIQNIISTLSG